MVQSVLRQAMFTLWLCLFFTVSFAQDTIPDRCGSVELLKQRMINDPFFKARRERQELQLRQMVSKAANLRTEVAQVTVPVVFHIVMVNPSLVTDAQIQAQIDTLNHDYAGTNGDSTKIPSYFKPLFGKSAIRFTLAQRTPANEPTNGIERVATTVSGFSMNTVSSAKHSFTGGIEAWNTSNYLNVWVCNLTGGLLGIATFPDDGVPDEQGVVIHYPTLPGSTLTNYNRGKTLVHEIGHYFNLIHIWGDDNGACTGSDMVDDTPNQGNSSNGCSSGVKTDNCTTTAPGIMYQNYMDYSFDDCMVMFTVQQAARMEAALTTSRSSLYGSMGGMPLVRFENDAELKLINSPQQRLCTGSFAPMVTLRNLGRQNLTTLTLVAKIDNGTPTTISWSGSLASLGQTVTSFPSLTTTTGNHTLTVYSINPNGSPDADPFTDTLRFAFIYYMPFNPPIAESFEGQEFPPTGWDIVNGDQSFTWEKSTGVAHTGQASALMRNYNYAANGQKDYLRLPEVNLSSADSAFVTFNVAASAASSSNVSSNVWDTLEVLISTDCGTTYESIYKRWGSNLVTTASGAERFFIPTSSEWRKDSIDLTNYISRGNVMLAFRNTNEFKNNIYLDDVNVYTKIVNPNLKAKGFLLTPVPVSNSVTIQFYPQPVNLRNIAIYSALGQKLYEINTSSGVNSLYQFDMSRYASGMYVAVVTFSDRVIKRKFLKVK